MTSTFSLKQMAHQSRKVFIAATLSTNKLNSFEEVLKHLSKAEIFELTNAVSDFCLAEKDKFGKARNKYLPLKRIYIVGKKFFEFSVEGASLVLNIVKMNSC